ncbi:Uncharacterised protein [Lysinibacillus sphaericus]|nr:Uncharacterised protein [Lysinibacillus sphaericus]
MAVLESIKGISNIVKEIGDIDLNKKIIDLQSEVFELLEENYQLKAEVRVLKEAADIQDRLRFKNNMYYFKDDTEDDEPFCTACWDQESKLVRLHINSWELYTCPVCMKKK